VDRNNVTLEMLRSRDLRVDLCGLDVDGFGSAVDVYRCHLEEVGSSYGNDRDRVSTSFCVWSVNRYSLGWRRLPSKAETKLLQ
jgi:hypothetical protein